jgi:hypothetical protein
VADSPTSGIWQLAAVNLAAFASAFGSLVAAIVAPPSE